VWVADEMIEREELCLAHGGKEFWLVDLQRETVKVIRSCGYTTIHNAESAIESGLLNESIPVRNIFSC